MAFQVGRGEAPRHLGGLSDEAHVLALDQDAATMARDLDERLCCPRDLGAPAAAAIRRLAALYE